MLSLIDVINLLCNAQIKPDSRPAKYWSSAAEQFESSLLLKRWSLEIAWGGSTNMAGRGEGGPAATRLYNTVSTRHHKHRPHILGHSGSSTSLYLATHLKWLIYRQHLIRINRLVSMQMIINLGDYVTWYTYTLLEI